MGITFSPECGSSFEPEPEDLERKKDRVRSPRGPGRPRKDRGDREAPKLRTRVPKFEDFDQD